MSLFLNTSNIYLTFLILISWFFRFFQYDLPALLQYDSVKYHVPLQVAFYKLSNWVWEQGVNFSPLYRLASYHIQTLNNGSLDIWIPIQKSLGILEVVLIYYMALYFAPQKYKQAFVIALTYSINPWRLFNENVIMAEGLYLPLIVLTLFFFVLLSRKLKHTQSFSLSCLCISLIIGALISLVPLTKEVTIWKYLIICGLFVFSFQQYLKVKTKVMFLCTAVIVFTSFIVDLPLMLYNLKHFQRFSIVAVPMMGNNIWALNETMIKQSKARDQWISSYILDLVKALKKKQSLPVDVDNHDVYLEAIIQITVSGRHGLFINPQTGLKMSSVEFSDTFSRYYFETSLSNLYETLKRIKQSIYNIYFKEVETFQLYRKSSWRQNSSYELQDIFLMVPASYNDLVSPKVRNLPLASTEFLTLDGWYVDKYHSYKRINAIPLHLDTTTNQALIYYPRNLNINWINLNQGFNWCGPVLIIFLFSIFVFLRNRYFLDFDLAQYFLLGNSLFFFLVPSLFAYGQSRYCLYNCASMLLFILSVFEKKQK
jgi:hypothetical protein